MVVENAVYSGTILLSLSMDNLSILWVSSTKLWISSLIVLSNSSSKAFSSNCSFKSFISSFEIKESFIVGSIISTTVFASKSTYFTTSYIFSIKNSKFSYAQLNTLTFDNPFHGEGYGKKLLEYVQEIFKSACNLMNRCIPNGMHGGVRGR